MRGNIRRTDQNIGGQLVYASPPNYIRKVLYNFSDGSPVRLNVIAHKGSDFETPKDLPGISQAVRCSTPEFRCSYLNSHLANHDPLTPKTSLLEKSYRQGAGTLWQKGKPQASGFQSAPSPLEELAAPDRKEGVKLMRHLAALPPPGQCCVGIRPLAIRQSFCFSENPLVARN